MRLRHRRRTRTPGRLRRTVPDQANNDDHHDADHDPEEHPIDLDIHVHDGHPDGPVVHIYDHRAGAAPVRNWLDNDELDDLWTAIDRALHDRRPALYHGGEPADDVSACSWCADLADAAPPGDGVTP